MKSSSGPKPSAAETTQANIDREQYARYEEDFLPLEQKLTETSLYDVRPRLATALSEYGAGSQTYEDQIAKQEGMEQRYLEGFGLPQNAPGEVGQAQDKQRKVMRAAAEVGLNQALRRGVPSLVRQQRAQVVAQGQGLPGQIQGGLATGINLATTRQSIDSQQSGMAGAAIGALGGLAAQGAGYYSQQQSSGGGALAGAVT